MAPLEAIERRQSRPAARPRPPLRCVDCGHVFRCRATDAVPRCRRCGSARCQETERQVGGSRLPADHSVEEDRFARMALWGDLITSEQFAECTETQKAKAAAGDPVPSLAELLVDNGYLRGEHAEAIYRVMTTRTPEQWRNHFGQLALRKGLLTESQLREALEFQTKLIMSSGSAPFLGHILIERGLLTEANALAILNAQKQHHIGLLYDLQQALRPPSGRLLDALRARRRGLAILGIALAVAAAGALGAWAHAHATAPEMFDLLCDQCNYRVRAPQSAIARPCPRCRRGQLCTRLWCSRCRVAFPLRVHSSEAEPPWMEACPRCGTLEHTELPPGFPKLPARRRRR